MNRRLTFGLVLVVAFALQVRGYLPEPGLIISSFSKWGNVGLQPDDIISDLSNPQSYNRYAYCLNNPLRFTDPDGHVAETAWDVANIGIGVASLVSNIKQGNVWGAVVDAGGIVLDTAAAAIPVVPGGAGTVIRVARAGNKAVDAVKATGKVRAGASAVQKTGSAGAKVVKAGVTDKETANVLKNAEIGRTWEKQVIESLKKTQENVVEQVTVKTKSGTRTRLDSLGRAKGTGDVKATEAKASASAPLTRNQTLAFPEIEKAGAVVVGKGKPGFEGGTKIPPTKVEIIRP